MKGVSRRGLLMGGGLLLGTGAAGSPFPAQAAGAGPASASAVAARQLGDPGAFCTIPALSTTAVMQDVVYVPSTDTLFLTQAVRGSNGSSSPSETTVVNRVRRSDGALLDAMQLIDAGHGLGFEVEMQGGQPWIWTTWQGASAASGGSEYDFVRLRYAPGRWQRGAANGQLGLRTLPVQDPREAVYHFDQPKDQAVERHFNWPQGSEAPSETYKRRRISEIRDGVDRTYGEITLAATPPTTQGFATVGGSLYRWVGRAATGNAIHRDDPVRLEQYSWATGRLVASRSYSTLSQRASGGWPDGTFEAEGMSVFRDADGSPSLLIGDSTGAAGNREYHVSRIAGLGEA